MANGKSLGLDGFPYEFYKSCWDFIGPYLHKVYLKSLYTISLGSLINKGNINFIPNKLYLDLITNWWSITLLNVSYRIITKVIALLPILPSIVCMKKLVSYRIDIFWIMLQQYRKAWNGIKPLINMPFSLSYILRNPTTGLSGINYFYVEGLRFWSSISQHSLNIFQYAYVIISLNNYQI